MNGTAADADRSRRPTPTLGPLSRLNSAMLEVRSKADYYQLLQAVRDSADAPAEWEA